MIRIQLAALALASAALASCATTPEMGEREAPSAEARLMPVPGYSLTGIARFEPAMFSRVTLRVEVTQAPQGRFAVHIHERGDCSAPDALSAGEHWNPASSPHGKYDSGANHLGDLENLNVDETGRGRIELTSREWTIGTGLPTDVLGKAIIIHEREDDFRTQPSGDSGKPIACGVIEPRREGPAVSLR